MNLSRTSDESGKFCAFFAVLSAVKVMPQLFREEVEQGIQFSPSSRIILLKSGPVLDVMFSQKRVSLFGKLSCLSKLSLCHAELIGSNDHQLVLLRDGQVVRKIALRSALLPSFNETSNALDLRISDIAPGSYIVTIDFTAYCWKNDRISLVVGLEDLNALNFEQVGYLVQLASSHFFEAFVEKSDKSRFFTAKINSGVTNICLPEAGMFL